MPSSMGILWTCNLPLKCKTSQSTFIEIRWLTNKQQSIRQHYLNVYYVRDNVTLYRDFSIPRYCWRNKTQLQTKVAMYNNNRVKNKIKSLVLPSHTVPFSSHAVCRRFSRPPAVWFALIVPKPVFKKLSAGRVLDSFAIFDRKKVNCYYFGAMDDR